MNIVHSPGFGSDWKAKFSAEKARYTHTLGSLETERLRDQMLSSKIWSVEF